MEKAYQKTKNFDRLSFLYLATGSIDKLTKMQKIAQSRADPMSRFHNALYLGDVAGRIAVLRDIGMCKSGFNRRYVFHLMSYPDPLAYLTAQTNGLNDLALEILEDAGLTEADVDDVQNFGTSTLKPPPVVTAVADLTWPTLGKAESFFDRALANGHLEADGDVPYMNGIGGAAASSALDDWAKDEEAHEDIDPEDGGWDLDAGASDAQLDTEEFTDAVEVNDDLGAGANPGVKETELWVRNSPFASDHACAGAFESAMQVKPLQLCNFFKLD